MVRGAIGTISKGLLSAIIGVLHVVLLTAQEIPQLTQYDRSTYHGARQNWDLAEDDMGYLYIANSDGVLLYNGLEWRLIPLPRNVKPRAIHYHRGRVYVAGYETIGYLDMTDRCHPTYVDQLPMTLRGNKEEYWQIASIGEALFFQSFSSAYLMVADGSARPVDLPGNVMLGSTSGPSYKLPVIDGPILDISAEAIDTVVRTGILPGPVRVAEVIQRGDDLLLFTQLKGIYSVKDGMVSTVDRPISTYLQTAQANKAILLRDGSIAIGTIQAGVYIVDADLSIKYHIDRHNGLNNNTVLALYQDVRDDLWVGLDNGIAQLSLSDDSRHYYDVAGELGTVTCHAVQDGVLLLGTNQGLFRRSAGGGYDLVPGSQGPVWSLRSWGAMLWVGHNLGCFVYKEGMLQRISMISGTWEVEPVDADHLIAVTYGGLVNFRLEDGRWQQGSSIYTPVLLSDIAVDGGTVLGYHDYTGLVLARLSGDSLIVERTVGELDGVDVLDGTVYFRDDRLHYTQGSTTWRLSDTSLVSVTSPTGGSVSEPEVVSRDYGYMTTAATTDLAKDDVDIYLDYWTYSAGGYDRSLTTQAADLPYDTYAISIHLGKRGGVAPPALYMISGWIDKWQPLPADGVIDILNLDDGEYQLEIRNGSEVEVLWQITIDQPWYKTGWLALLLALVALLLVLLVRGYSRSKLDKQRARLQAEQDRAIAAANMKAINQKLETEVKNKSMLLANRTLTLAQKNMMLSDLRQRILLSARESGKPISQSQVIRMIDRNIDSDEDWVIFEQNFDEVHEAFIAKLRDRYPDLSAGELRLASFIRMDLSSKQIAPLFNISVRSVENKRYRLRKKLQLAGTDNLSDFIQHL